MTYTPTEDLLLELLAARHRLGEAIWTLDSRHAPTLRRLEARGLVETTHGIVERTVRASLTVKGLREFCSFDYAPPLYRSAVRAAQLLRDFADGFGEAGRIAMANEATIHAERIERSLRIVEEARP